MSSLETVTHGVTDDQLINATGIRNLAINMSDVRTKRLSKSYLHNECVIQKSNFCPRLGFLVLFLFSPKGGFDFVTFVCFVSCFFNAIFKFFMAGKRLQEMLGRGSDEPPGGPLGFFFFQVSAATMQCVCHKLLCFGIAFASK